MNIADAIGKDEKGKIHKKNRCNNLYAKKDETGRLRWYDKGTHEALDTVLLWDILDDDWQPCHEAKEIRPEKSGELWKKSCDRFVYMIVEGKINCLTATPSISYLLSFDVEKHGKDMVHGKGWTRLYPKVEDESVERIEFEGIIFDNSCDVCDCPSPVKPYRTYTKGFGNQLEELCDKPPMKMILEIPKEDI